MEYTFYAFDTDCIVHIDEEHDAEKLQQLFDEIQSWHVVFNVFDEKSEVSRFNRAKEDFVATPLFYQVTKDMMDYAESANRLFEPFVEMVQSPFRQGETVSQEIREQYQKAHQVGVIHFLPNRLMRKSMPQLAINFHSFLKGYACDYMRDYMYEELDLRNFLVDFGGNLLAEGMRDADDYWYVGIQSVINDQEEVAHVSKLRDESLVTSANYERPVLIEGKRYSHMMKPLSGEYMPYAHKSVSVYHPKSAVAEVLSTALFASEEADYQVLLDRFSARAIVQNDTKIVEY